MHRCRHRCAGIQRARGIACWRDVRDRRTQRWYPVRSPSHPNPTTQGCTAVALQRGTSEMGVNRKRRTCWKVRYVELGIHTTVAATHDDEARSRTWRQWYGRALADELEALMRDPVRRRTPKGRQKGTQRQSPHDLCPNRQRRQCGPNGQIACE